MTKKKLIAIATLVIQTSCGGTHGKIETFPFDAPKDSIEKIISQISGNDSIYFLPNDALTYKDIYLQKGFFFKTFTYHFYGDSITFWSNNKNKCAISLVYIKNTEKFRSAKYLSNEEKKEAIIDFKKHFIDRINSKLKQP